MTALVLIFLIAVGGTYFAGQDSNEGDRYFCIGKCHKHEGEPCEEDHDHE